ncbi:MAG TPA: hypothetical protein GXX35_08740 [Thermoanaerobacterales bacterium]|nr:hypothetical protein [Thermoanaerobacterales bacterium]
MKSKDHELVPELMKLARSIGGVKHKFDNLRFNVIDILINRKKTHEIIHIKNTF